MKNATHWFEIPAADLPRASRFYETTFAIELRAEGGGGPRPMAIFPYEPGGVGGALVADQERAGSPNGVLLYLDAEGKLDACLARVTAAGGAVVQPRTAIGPNGFIAIVRDTEGNLVGLHSDAP